VPIKEIEALLQMRYIIHKRWDAPGGVPMGWLNLDDIGAQIRKQLRAVSALTTSKIQDSVYTQSTFFLLHHNSTSFSRSLYTFAYIDRVF